MDLTFNVIFVPASVRYLRLSVLSMLRFTPYRFRLVANCLPSDERFMLSQFCAKHDRLEMLDFHHKDIQTHGMLLTELQHRERGARFCFMDSDIFATAPLAQDLEKHLDACDVFSSCQQLAVDPGQVWVGLDGRCTEAPNGLPLATTFFAVYRTSPLHEVIEATGLTMMRYEERELIPEPVWRHLNKIGLTHPEFDTAKLLNVLMSNFGLRFTYAPLEMLHHIGGMTQPLLMASQPSVYAEFRRVLSSPLVLRDKDFAMVVDDCPSRIIGPRPDVKRRKHRIAAFFVAYLEWLFDGRPEPRLESNHPLAERLRRICAVIRELYDVHRGALTVDS